MDSGGSESSRHPRCGVVAGLALLGESRTDVVRTVCALVIGQVARNTGGTGLRVVSFVALVAAQIGMSPGQRETYGSMVESRWLPSCGRVAFLASLRNAERDVIWIAGLLIVRQMAADARGRRALILSAYVARGAIESGVHAREGESGALEVIEFCPQPGVDGVALFTLDGEGGGCCRVTR